MTGAGFGARDPDCCSTRNPDPDFLDRFGSSRVLLGLDEGTPESWFDVSFIIGLFADLLVCGHRLLVGELRP